MQIIPAIDIIDGKCVRLTEGDYTQKTVYDASPLEMAEKYEQHGIRRLHVVDLDGAKAGKVVNWHSIEEIAKHTNLVIDFGGGVKTKEDVERIISMGIQYITVGSIAVKEPLVFSEWLQYFGADRFMLGADIKDDKVMVSGWMETSNLALFPFLDQYVNKGVKHIFCTDISKDGKLEGPSFSLYASLKKRFSNVSIIASGGVACLDDLYKLHATQCDGVIIGKAIYEKRISISELEKFINESK
jgi:phosphoribosylformimino-5-aminoimidazole carboxamide ribotide isomerase